MDVCICKSCQAKIIWATFLGRGTPIPIDFDPVPNGNLVIKAGQAETFTPLFHGPEVLRYRSHFATCKHAERHRRRRAQ